MRPANDVDETGPRYRIGRVAELTGLSTHAIRVWERRHRVIAPRRSEGGERLYSQQDVAKLGLLRRLSERGHPIGTVAHMSIDELTRLSDETEVPSSTGVAIVRPDDPGAGMTLVRDRFMDAIVKLDVTAASDTLARAALLLPTRDLLVSVIAPIVREIGDRWERTEMTVAGEHAASAMLRNLLGSLLRTFPTLPGAPVALSTTLPGERHEFGALMAACLAASRGWRAVHMGPDQPPDDVVLACRRLGARMLLMSSAMTADAQRKRDLRRIIHALGRETRVVFGGAGAPSYGAAAAGASILTDLTTLDVELVRER